MMEEDLEGTAIAAVKSVGERGPTTPIPSGVRQAVMAYANAARRSGRSWRDIAGVVGVSAAALYNWRSEAPASDRRQVTRRRLAPVVVRDQVRDREHTLVLVTPAGHRIEGLDVPGMAELVRRLG